MRRASCFSAVVLLSLVSAARAESDLQTLQGAWAIDSVEENGKPSTDLKDGTLTFIADNVVAYSKRPSGGTRYEANSFKLDEAASPRQMTIMSPRDADRPDATAIYKIEKDTLTICIAHGANGPALPTDFTSGEKKNIVTLKRQAPAEPLKGDAKLLQGSWAVETPGASGDVTISIGGDLVVKCMKQSDGKRTTEVNRVTLDETTSPRRLTVRSLKSGEEQVSRGLYSLDGDQLKICAPEGDSAEYPADFNAADSKTLVLKRKK